MHMEKYEEKKLVNLKPLTKIYPKQRHKTNLSHLMMDIQTGK